MHNKHLIKKLGIMAMAAMTTVSSLAATVGTMSLTFSCPNLQSIY